MEKALKAKLSNGCFQSVSAARSRTMSAVKSIGNRTTERRVRALLMAAGIRGWVLHARHVVGRPDFFFERERVAIFVDGCFWHGCPKCGHIPRTNKLYWKAKIERNKQRDRSIRRAVRTAGYRVVEIWECDLKTHPKSCLARMRRAISAESLVEHIDLSARQPPLGMTSKENAGTEKLP
jgi:DNA mismatch endonuclease (patch repair protein)